MDVFCFARHFPQRKNMNQAVFFLYHSRTGTDKEEEEDLLLIPAGNVTRGPEPRPAGKNAENFITPLA